MGAAAAQKRSWDGAEEEGGGGDERGGEGADGVCRGVGVHPICCAFVARAERVNRTPMQLHPAGFPSTQKEQVLKPLSLNVLLLKWTTTGSFLISSICLAFNYERKGSLKWTRSALITAPIGPGVCGCTCTPPCWRGAGRVRASPLLLQVNDVTLMLKTSCSGSTNRCLCVYSVASICPTYCCRSGLSRIAHLGLRLPCFGCCFVSRQQHNTVFNQLFAWPEIILNGFLRFLIKGI